MKKTRTKRSAISPVDESLSASLLKQVKKGYKRTKKAKKETISVKILNYALNEIYKRLNNIDDQLVAIRYKDADVIDLDKTYGWITTEEFREIKGYVVDDNEEVGFTKDELEALIFLIDMETNRQEKQGILPSIGAGTIYHKLNKMLKDK